MTAGAEFALLPRPRRAEWGTGSVTLTSPVTVFAEPGTVEPGTVEPGIEQGAKLASRALWRSLADGAGLDLIAVDDAEAADIVLRLAGPADQLLPGPRGSLAESYRLVVGAAVSNSRPSAAVISDSRPSAAVVEIVGGGPAGIFYGVQTLLQLLPAQVFRAAAIHPGPYQLPVVTIDDAPVYAWRGVMLDVARHFRPRHEILRLIDQAAAHRLNRLHLHLTEDQGWRIEILAYPKLTEVGGWRTESQVGAHIVDEAGNYRPWKFDGRPHGGWYSQDDLREIVAYADARCITVVPEIETPGHARAALAAYPELGVTGQQLDVWTEWGISEDVLNTEPETIAFFQQVFDEVVAIFPSEVIGVGGDECPKVQWQADVRSQRRMQELGLRNTDELQAWVVSQFVTHLQALSRRAIGWDEILDGDLVPKDAIILSWRGLAGAVSAARRGHDVVSCPDHSAYLDFRQSDDEHEPIPIATVLDVAAAYRFDPVPEGLSDAEASHIIGGQANMWTEHVDGIAGLDYQLFPRLAAIAEALWSADQPGPRDFGEFEPRLNRHLDRLTAMGIGFRPASGPPPWLRRPGVPGRPMNP